MEHLESQERQPTSDAPAAGSGGADSPAAAGREVPTVPTVFVGWQPLADSLELEAEGRQREARLARRLSQVSQQLMDRDRRVRGLETQVQQQLEKLAERKGHLTCTEKALERTEQGIERERRLGQQRIEKERNFAAFLLQQHCVADRYKEKMRMASQMDRLEHAAKSQGLAVPRRSRSAPDRLQTSERIATTLVGRRRRRNASIIFRPSAKPKSG